MFFTIPKNLRICTAFRSVKDGTDGDCYDFDQFMFFRPIDAWICRLAELRFNRIQGLLRHGFLRLQV